MSSRTLKKNKRTKYRSSTRRQRRRQMRGGALLDFFKPKVETNETCQETYNKCLDKVAGKEDNNSFFKFTTFNLFGSSDTEKEDDEGLELQEYPVDATPVVDVAADQAAAAAAADQAAAAAAAAADQAAAAAATDQAAAAAATDQAAAAAATDQAAAAAAVPLSTTPVIVPPQDASMGMVPQDASMGMGMVPQDDLSTPLLATGLDAQAEAEAEENARKNNAMGVVPQGDVSMEGGGGSRKKYKRRNANRSKKNKNRRNKRRTNKRN